MSHITVRVTTSHIDFKTTAELRVRGLGPVVLTGLPFMTTGREQYEALHRHINLEMREMYDYCAPRSGHKVIYMTWAQAEATSKFLKETN